ncbi:MAG: hypothetical protein SFY68_03870 [Candidatus Sumerlaeia bacterium]|nr:hypothetical protein [Candidatus Sumerlaeia bacterium]
MTTPQASHPPQGSVPPNQPALGLWERMKGIARWFGINEAILYVLIGRGWSILSAVLTIKIVLLCLTPELQGFYYMINNLIQAQLFLELGVGTVIMHMASAEFARLRWNGELLEGDQESKSRLASLIRQTLTFYGAITLLFMVIIGIIGIMLMSKSGVEAVAWLIPWMLIVFGNGVKLAMTPILLVMAGAGRINIVSRYQTFAQIISLLFMWAALLADWGLYSLVFLSLGNVVILQWGVVRYFWRCLVDLWKTPPLKKISWMKEIWPFQSRSGINTIGDWLLLQLITPLIFANQGAVEAGRLGMTLSMVLVFTSIGGLWMQTRSVEFSKMLSLGKSRETFAYYASIQRKTLPVVIGGMVCLVVGIELLGLMPFAWMREIQHRVLDSYEATLLCLFALGNYLYNNTRIYLRSYRREPYFLVSLFFLLGLLTGNLFFSTYSLLHMLLFQLLYGGVAFSILIYLVFPRMRAWFDAELEVVEA